jgi:hypothetical protein
MPALIENFYSMSQEERLAAMRTALVDLGYSQSVIDKMRDNDIMTIGVDRLTRSGIIPPLVAAVTPAAGPASAQISDVDLLTLRQAAATLGSALKKVYPPTQATDAKAIIEYSRTVCQLATNEMYQLQHAVATSAKFSKPEFEVGTKVMILDFNDGMMHKADEWAGCIGVIDSLDRTIVRNENANGTSLTEGDVYYSVFISEPAEQANKTARKLTHWRLQPVR